MTISAQVIDTIVEWIDDNLHQPLRIDDIARHEPPSQVLALTSRCHMWLHVPYGV